MSKESWQRDRCTDLHITAGEDALGLPQHALQPVLIDCVCEVDDGSLPEGQLRLILPLKVEESPPLLARRWLGGRGEEERERGREAGGMVRKGEGVRGRGREREGQREGVRERKGGREREGGREGVRGRGREREGWREEGREREGWRDGGREGGREREGWRE